MLFQDVEIAIDMMSLINSYDTAVLLSGDGDLAYAVSALGYRGVRVKVVSLRSMISDSLINIADRYTDIDTIMEDIRKTAHRSRSQCVESVQSVS
ncbi:MAG TPA: NYN domain-containing protein [Thermosynechococcaceae cyanobacterium]